MKKQYHKISVSYMELAYIYQFNISESYFKSQYTFLIIKQINHIIIKFQFHL